jgi:hypothetical protein
MGQVFNKIPVPGSRGYAAKAAEEYFVQRLAANYQPMGYVCYREYEYAGGSTFYPVNPSAGHTDRQLERILRMLQGDNEQALGFRHLPKPKGGKVKQRGHQKPDFLAFRVHDGVVAEVGTSDMSRIKQQQLAERLRALRELVEEELTVQSMKSIGSPTPWHGMSWRPTDYLPEEGPVMIAVNDSEIISTAATWQYGIPGVYLYDLYRYEQHRQPVGVPFTLPALSRRAQQQVLQAVRQYTVQPPSPAQHKSWLDSWPALRDELTSAAKGSAPALAVGAIVVAVVLLAPATTAAAVAGVAAVAAVAIQNKSSLGGAAT